MLPLLPWAPRLLMFLFLASVPSCGFFSWLTRSAAPAPVPDPAPPPEPENLLPVPFEMTTADERFLAEAHQLHLSPLDSCHHKVVGQLHSSCTDLTEEELAKLGVSLFNCQARTEGRRTYLCTAEMTLAECTAKMDPDTWNAYHIVSNRARAVCYATRQTQFKRQTEHTVSALVSTAISQLDALKMLKSGQEELKVLASESLEKVASGQEELLAQQARFQDSQEQMEGSIHHNLAQLEQEKALIASGQQQVAQLIEGITKRMENVSTHLSSQDAELQEGHKAILSDLTEVQIGAQEVYAKIETSLGSFLSYQNQTTQYYDELMRKLQKMNDSLELVLSSMDHMQSKVEARLQHIQRFITWAGFSLGSTYTCVLHGSYFLLAALVMAFLQTPGLSRVMLLVLVAANALAELNHSASLGFHSLTSLLVFVVTGNWLLRRLVHSALRKRKMVVPVQDSKNMPKPLAHAKRCCVTSTPEREDDDNFWKGELENLEEVSYMSEESNLEKETLERVGDVPPPPQVRVERSAVPLSSGRTMSLRHLSLSRYTRQEVSRRPVSSAVEFQHHHLDITLAPSPRASANISMVSDMSTSSPSSRPTCQATTRTGQPCRKKALQGHAYCHVHESGQASYIN